MERDQANIIIYNTPDGKASVSLMTKDGNVWMNQKQLAVLFDTSKQNIGQHIGNILIDRELESNSVVKKFFTTAQDGKEYEASYYALDMVLAIGFRVRSKRGTQFRIWANRNLKSYMIKGFVMDDERLKNPNGRPDYFDELLERIRDIRADASDKATQMFFAETQNKLIYAVTNQTAAELILERANPKKANMGLTSWKGSIVRKADIVIAKNYLDENEIYTLNRLVTIFLESAELRAKDRMDITTNFWKENVDKILEFQEKKILIGKGHVSSIQMKEKVKELYATFDKRRKTIEAENADLLDINELESTEVILPCKTKYSKIKLNH